MEQIIQVKEFTKKYGKFTAVNHVSFQVEKNSIFALLGPNGAGKSTTINTLCTIFGNYEGHIQIDGHNIKTEKNKVRESIGVVFQDPTLDKDMTVEDNLIMHCHFYKVPKNEIQERIKFVLSMVDLYNWRKSKVATLSGGMKRRIEIARGLIHYPKVLFLDEPTTGLDPQTRANIWDYVVKLQREKGITIFLTTHYMDEAEICDQVAIMDGGKIVAHDTPNNLKKKYTKDKAIIETKNPKKLEMLLEEKAFTYETKEGLYFVETQGVSLLLDLLETIKKDITDIEIKKGTLNDVFLAITGKDIRE